jgi:hypothetical protein
MRHNPIPIPTFPLKGKETTIPGSRVRRKTHPWFNCRLQHHLEREGTIRPCLEGEEAK